MATDTENRRSTEELERLGNEILHHRIEPQLNPDDKGKFVAIDVDDGSFEIDEDDYTAVMRLWERKPSPRIWLACAGYPTAFKMGWRGTMAALKSRR